MTAREDLLRSVPDVSEDRAARLRPLAAWIARNSEHAPVVFVCTHNSRRSHMAAVWAQAAADHLDLTGVRASSAGTEATALHANALAALRAQGFEITATGEEAGTGNPIYRLGPQALFSKTLDDPSLPQQDFAAVMVCTDADERCPAVLGAALRISLPFEDPKASDGTGREPVVYGARAAQIGGEMLWLMQEARRLL